MLSIDLTNYATIAYVATAVTNLVNSAPTTLDTLRELAAALGDDPSFSTTIAALIASKQGSLSVKAPLILASNILSINLSGYQQAITSLTTLQSVPINIICLAANPYALRMRSQFPNGIAITDENGFI